MVQVQPVELYIEIKGWKRPEFEAKMKYFPHEIEVLFKKDLTEMFEYVTNEYGEDFTNLYKDKE